MKQNMIGVLLIEDDPMVQEVNRQFIERVEGFRVVGTARNGQDGLNQLAHLKPDLILMDIYMPKQDGIQTLIEIRKKQIDVDVIVISAANDPETIRTMLRNGAADYIIKPFKFERIKQALERYRSYLQKQNDPSLTQHQLDQMLFPHRIAGDVFEESNLPMFHDPLPKGLNQTTLNQIMHFLMNQNDPQSAEQVADGIGIARVTARRYLDFLEKSGAVKLEILYGGVGRPINRYLFKR